MGPRGAIGDTVSAASKLTRRIGVFGGSFDPPHVAHQLVCTLALSVGGVDQVWLVPCFRHAFDKRLAPFEDRLLMCRMAAEPFGSRALVSDVEQTIGGVSRTIVTLEHLREQRPEASWVIVLGSDILGEVERWQEWERIQELAELFVVGRAEAAGVTGVSLPNISSSEIRERLGRGEDVTGLVPGAVLAHIRSRGLYEGAPSGRME